MTKIEKVNVDYKDVIKWFDSADSQLAGLVLDIIHNNREDELKKAAEVSNRMAKARKGRSKGNKVASQSAAPEPVNGVVADPTVQAEVASQLPVVKRGPGRPRKVAATGATVATSPSQSPDYQAYLADSEPEVAEVAVAVQGQ